MILNTEPDAIDLLEEALLLCQHGERAPGGNETRGEWARKTEHFLRMEGMRRDEETL